MHRELPNVFVVLAADPTAQLAAATRPTVPVAPALPRAQLARDSPHDPGVQRDAFRGGGRRRPLLEPGWEAQGQLFCISRRRDYVIVVRLPGRVRGALFHFDREAT